ncbi:endonuclease [Acidianus sulfidivorans JP7]|uniref:Endonuclease n=1 Tax=Acidianus sulfidivorans JP7 TaxID=619593 RepID=A0A2U9IQ10_9CREN|nr:Holliday junction resolvase-like protein [Acidianus sulfidivorans]AWR98139.1 endonuclease [Acidianus sulfidivorans JP7]
MALVLDIFLIFILIIVILYYRRKISGLNKQIDELKTKAQEIGQQTFNQWVQQYSQQLRQQIEEATKKEYEAKLEQWRQQSEENIRKDAIQRSVNTLLGRIGEEFAPLLIADKYNINPKDFRHLGTPVDYIAFKGLSDEQNDPEVIFFEIKSGKTSSLTERERKVRDAIKNLKVRYEVISLHDIISEVQKKINDEINKI